jgi:molybdopterin converting factor small subunit
MSQATSVTVSIPSALRRYCGGAAQVAVAADSVRAALAELARSYPAVHQSVCDETGALRRHIGVFVNRTHLRDREGLDTQLAPGDVVTILPAVSGG